MKLKLIAAAVTIATLAMPATAIAGGGQGGAGSGGSRSADHGATGRASTAVLAFGTGYDRAGGSPQVRILQRRLAVAGFAPGPVDGLYGPRTTAAVWRFQAAGGLRTDGIAGPQTLAVLASPVTTVYPGSGYGPGGSRLVRHLQRLLTGAGYSPGRVDGLYGPHTEHAVQRFQAAHRLPIDGIAHPETFIALATQSQAVGRLRPATPHGSTGPSATKPAPPQTTTVAGPSHAPAPAIAGGPRQPSGASPIVWLTILGVAVAAVVLLIAALYTRRRAARPAFRAVAAGVDGHPVAASNGHPVAASNGHPVAASNGHKRGGAVRADEAFRVGLLCEEQDDLTGAEAAYRRADDAGHAAAASNLGVLLERRHDLAAAEEAYRRADERGEANGSFNLAMLLEEQDDLTGAEAAYRRADDRGHAAAASNLGVLLQRRHDLAAAEEAYRRADERGEANGSFNLAMLLEEQGDLTGAEAAYRRADDRGHAAAASNLGVLLERRHDLPGAEEAYRRADERGDPNGSFNLAVLLEEQSDLTGAEAAYRRADERGPTDVTNAARAALVTLRTSRDRSPAATRGDVRVG